MKPSQRPFHTRPRGTVLVVAMLYVMLFCVLAVGFSASTAMSIQTAARDRSSADAQAAAESGLQWARYRLSQLPIDRSFDETAMSAAVHHCLGDAESNFVTLDAENGLRFRTSVSVRPGTIELTVIGRGNDATIQRAATIEFQLIDGHLSALPETYKEVAP